MNRQPEAGQHSPWPLMTFLQNAHRAMSARAEYRMSRYKPFEWQRMLEQNRFGVVLGYARAVRSLVLVISSPRALLHAQLEGFQLRRRMMELSIVADGDTLMLQISASITRVLAEDMDCVGWWVLKMGLPVTFTALFAQGELSLDHAALRNVRALRLGSGVSHLVISPRVLSGIRSLQCSGALTCCCGLGAAQLPALRSLTLNSVSGWPVPWVTELLGLEELHLAGRISEMDAGVLACGNSLHHLRICSGTANRITGLQTFRALRTMNVSACLDLEDLSPLLDAHNLETLDVRSCGARSVPQLSRCRQLLSVDFSGCGRLQDVSGLVGAPSLERIAARRTDIRVTGPLHLCPSLVRRRRGLRRVRWPGRLRRRTEAPRVVCR